MKKLGLVAALALIATVVAAPSADAGLLGGFQKKVRKIAKKVTPKVSLKKLHRKAKASIKKGWNKVDNAIGGNIVKALPKAKAGLQKGWNKVDNAIGGNVVKALPKAKAGLQKAVRKVRQAPRKIASRVKKLFRF